MLLVSMVNSVSIATNSQEYKIQNETIVKTEIVELTEEQYIELVVKKSIQLIHYLEASFF